MLNLVQRDRSGSDRSFRWWASRVWGWLVGAWVVLILGGFCLLMLAALIQRDLQPKPLVPLVFTAALVFWTVGIFASRWNDQVALWPAATGLLVGVVWLGLVIAHASSHPSAGRTEKGSVCDSHRCNGDFYNEPGYVVECADGTWSQAGGIQGACSGHGGEQ